MKWLIGFLVWIVFCGLVLIFNYGAHCKDREIDKIYEDEKWKS